MFGNTLYGNLPYGDATTLGNAVIAAQAVGIEATLHAPTLVLDYHHLAQTLRVGAELRAPAIRIDFVSRPDALSVPAELHAPAVINRLPAAWFRERLSNAPVWLVEITPPNGGGTLYFATRNLRPEVGARYEDYISSISGLGEELRRGGPLGLNSDITIEFRNDPWGPYAHLVERGEDFPFEGADVVIKEAYLYGDGLISQPDTLFRGNLEPPGGMDLMRFTCRVSSREFMADRRWKQSRVEQTEFPDAYEDAGKIIPVVYGKPGKVPALRTSWGARTTLAAQLNSSQTSAEVSDASRFPSAGHAWVDEEKVWFTRTGNTMTILRGRDGTEATSHRRGAQVWEHRSHYDSVLADHPLHAVDAVYAEIDGELVRVTSGVSNFVDSNGRHVLRASDQIRVAVADNSLALDDQMTVDDDITITGTPAMKTVYPSAGTGAGSDPNVMADGNEYTSNDIPADSLPRTATIGFNSTYYGEIIQQYYWVKMLGKAKIAGAERNTSFASWVRVKSSSKNWGSSISIQTMWNSGLQTYLPVTIYEAYKEVEYNPGQLTKNGSAYRQGEISLTGGVVATRNVERFHADVQGYSDITGAYGGSGLLIERPDHMIKHFLIERLGYEASEVDAASFDTAGASMASAVAGGYKFAFALAGEETPSDLLREMAFECRSVLRHDGTRWTLAWLLDTAPASERTIDASDIAGEGTMMTFDRTPLEEMVNSLTVRYGSSYISLGSEPQWEGSQEIVHSPSNAKYGSYPRGIDLRLVRDQLTAISVGGHIIQETAFPRLRVKFTVFTEHFGLEPGDSFDITNGLFGGRKFFIEKVTRQDTLRAEVEALEWY